MTIEDIPDIEMEAPNGDRIIISIEDGVLNRPTTDDDKPSYPRQCMESQGSYTGDFNVIIGCSVGEKHLVPNRTSLGGLPVMVKSNLCNLKGKSPKDLVRHGEEINNPGGYF